MGAKFILALALFAAVANACKVGSSSATKSDKPVPVCPNPYGSQRPVYSLQLGECATILAYGDYVVYSFDMAGGHVPGWGVYKSHNRVEEYFHQFAADHAQRLTYDEGNLPVMILQEDGNLVFYTSRLDDADIMGTSQTTAKPQATPQVAAGASAQLTADGVFQVLDAQKNVLWSRQ